MSGETESVALRRSSCSATHFTAATGGATVDRAMASAGSVQTIMAPRMIAVIAA